MRKKGANGENRTFWANALLRLGVVLIFLGFVVVGCSWLSKGFLATHHMRFMPNIPTERQPQDLGLLSVGFGVLSIGVGVLTFGKALLIYQQQLEDGRANLKEFKRINEIAKGIGAVAAFKEVKSWLVDTTVKRMTVISGPTAVPAFWLSPTQAQAIAGLAMERSRNESFDFLVLGPRASFATEHRRYKSQLANYKGDLAGLRSLYPGAWTGRETTFNQHIDRLRNLYNQVFLELGEKVKPQPPRMLPAHINLLLVDIEQPGRKWQELVVYVPTEVLGSEPEIIITDNETLIRAILADAKIKYLLSLNNHAVAEKG